jgi:serine/threonine-protein kinase RsbT
VEADVTVFDEVLIQVTVSDDIVAARQAGHQLARDLGFSLTDVTMIATAISEIARNITSYAGSGRIQLAVADREGRKALVVKATDEGPGIVDIARALEDGYSSGGGLGLGLPGARRMMDRLEVRSAPQRGTTVEMWKYVPHGRAASSGVSPGA